MQLISLGCNNFLSADQFLTVVSPEAAPVRRMVGVARENGRLIDATCGRKTQSVIVAASGHVILSSLSTDRLARQMDPDAVRKGEGDE